MDSEKGAPETPREGGALSETERAALVSEWRKNKPDLSWKPLEGRELDRFLPLKNWLLRGFVGVVMVGGVTLILTALMSQVSAPTKPPIEVKGTVVVVGKPNEDGYVTAVVDIDGEMPMTVPYHGSAELKQGQRVVLETLTGNFIQRQRYRFKNPPDTESE